jgi:hypothetical protein
MPHVETVSLVLGLQGLHNNANRHKAAAPRALWWSHAPRLV